MLEVADVEHRKDKLDVCIMPNAFSSLKTTGFAIGRLVGGPLKITDMRVEVMMCVWLNSLGVDLVHRL